MKADQWLYLDLSSPALIPALPSCGRGVVEVRLLPLPADFRQERKDWFASGTSYPGVSRLTPPNAEVGIDVYEFDREDLRDAWGNKQAFYVRGVAAVMSIHAAPEIDVMVTRRADDCFFENGSEIARHIRDFLLDRMKVER